MLMLLLMTIATIAAAYAIGTIPIPYLAGRATTGIDIREVGSGNSGASNVWQSVSKWLVVPVGLAQIAQGLAAVLIARSAGQSSAVQAACGVAVLIANDWNPWLGLAGGRGVGQTIGVLIALTPWALGAFVVISLIGVALRAIPQFVALGLIAAPIAAVVSGEPAPVVVGCAALATIAMVKRLLANGAPDPSCERPRVWLIRLACDRDIRDRDAWVRRGVSGHADPSARS